MEVGEFRLRDGRNYCIFKAEQLNQYLEQECALRRLTVWRCANLPRQGRLISSPQRFFGQMDVGRNNYHPKYE
jgi:hypothetical protein